jgi:lipoprotein-releasing system ATP-binding protein
MSNVQSPTPKNKASASGERETNSCEPDLYKANLQNEKLRGANAHSQGADFGPWTLDIGPLKVTDLRKAFLSPNGERIEVLRGISFSAKAGETIAIVGASGAGKSTLLHLIGGIEVPDHGNIKLGEFAVEGAPRAKLARYRNRQVGFVFQFHHLLRDLTAAENVSLPLALARQDRRKAMRRALEALDRLGLATRASHRVTDLSGGEQQRVAVCRALITQPVLVLADEPTGNLDAISGDLLAGDLISYAASRPAIVIIATHNQALARLCDRRLTLEQGRVSEE